MPLSLTRPELRDISSLDTCRSQMIPEFQPTGRGRDRAFLYDIVSNQNDSFDVDKFDYLIRDSVITKVSRRWHSYSARNLINNIQSRKIPKNIYDTTTGRRYQRNHAIGLLHYYNSPLLNFCDSFPTFFKNKFSISIGLNLFRSSVKLFYI
uniref:Uncharacterized protein n=1 Tax=Heterorhabditis bacteriophora TaxID=37862 RepID=A0A1I7W6R5_HETBA